MKKDMYKELILKTKSLLNDENEIISNESNFIALIKEYIPNVSWVGIYYYNKGEENLYLGPFQGKVACTNIKLGKGVCGDCAVKKETIIVPNVLNYKGHIACDSLTRSEIVIPLLKEKDLYGVLDIDSYEFNNFDDVDKENLEKMVSILLSI